MASRQGLTRKQRTLLLTMDGDEWRTIPEIVKVGNERLDVASRKADLLRVALVRRMVEGDWFPGLTRYRTPTSGDELLRTKRDREDGLFKLTREGLLLQAEARLVRQAGKG